MWLTHFWHSWSQFFIFAWDVTAGGILRTGVLICLVLKVYMSLFLYVAYQGNIHILNSIYLLILKGFNVNSLAPGKFEWNFRYAIFKQILKIDGWGISCEIALVWMWLDFTDDLSTLVQVMAWCRQATSHYLSQCWPKSLLPYGVTRPQRVKNVFTCIFIEPYLSLQVSKAVALHPTILMKWRKHWALRLPGMVFLHV